MAKITVPVKIQLGKGDASVIIFNHLVSFENYFTKSGTWSLNLAPGKYSVSIAGTCPPGGTVDINITGLSAAQPPMPFPQIANAGPFVETAIINV